MNKRDKTRLQILQQFSTTIPRSTWEVHDAVKNTIDFASLGQGMSVGKFILQLKQRGILEFVKGNKFLLTKKGEEEREQLRAPHSEDKKPEPEVSASPVDETVVEQ